MKPLKALELNLQGLNLVEASAGTGKTYTITTLVARLLTEAPYYSIDQILVVTFTNAATAELRNRVRDRISQIHAELEQVLGQKSGARSSAQDEVVETILTRPAEEIEQAQSRLSDALREFDRAAIYTIHGFCQRTLQENAFECGIRFDAELIKDDKTLLKNAVYDFWNNEIANQDLLFIQYLDGSSITPDNFLRLATRRNSKSEALLLPASATVSGLDYTAYNAAYTQVYEKWSDPKIRTEVEKIILKSPDLDRNRIRSADKKLESMRADLAEEFPNTPSLSGDFEIIGTASGLNQRTKQKKQEAGVFVGDTHEFFKQGEELWNEYADLGSQLRSLRIALELKLLECLDQDIRQRKALQNVQSYHDLLKLLDEGLDGRNGAQLGQNLAKRYPVALIDEFQDTDPIQFRIFSKIYDEEASPVFIIGDPKQAIYSFRSADIFAYQRAARKAEKNSFTLGTNWRSDPKLIDAMNHLFSSVDSPFLYDGIAFSPVDARPGAEDVFTVNGESVAPLTLQILESTNLRTPKTNVINKDLARKKIVLRTAAHIANTLDPKSNTAIREVAIHAGQIAVLVRTNAEANQIQEALRAHRVPSVIQGAGSVFASKEAEDLYTLLTGIAEPNDARALRAALSTDIVGLTAKDIDDLNTDEVAWEFWKQQFLNWQEAWNKLGFVQMMRGLLIWSPSETQARIQTRLLQFPDGERRITNVLHLTERLHDRARAGRMGAQGLLRWFADMRAESHKTDDEEELRLETDDRAVKIITVHKSKGLQYPIVYCPFLWDGKLLDSDSKNFLTFHDTVEPHDLMFALGDEITEDRLGTASHEARAESLRLLYVAITRAQHRLFVLFGAINSADTSSLAHLLLPSTDADLSVPRGEAIAASAEDDELMENCINLAARCPGTISVELLADETGATLERQQDLHAEHTCRPSNRALSLTWRKSSYSGLVGHTVGPTIHSVPEQDHDEEEAEDTQETPADTDDTVSIPLDGFIRNAVAGDCFHEIYEYIDFTNQDPSHLKEVVVEKLSAYGFDVDVWTEKVCLAIAETLDTPLMEDDSGLALRVLTPSDRLNEMEFLFPVAHGGNNLNAERLSLLFRKHAKNDLDIQYADSLRRLTFGGLRGYLKGFIDLVFRHQGKWYIADYKSNYLGKNYTDYAPEHLRESMMHKHYVLQYHVYALALHRHLQQRMTNYQYKDVFGGAFYFYIKGMTPEQGSNSGVYFERPSEEMVLDLDALFSGTLEIKS